MNMIHLSNDERFIEGWHNGAIIITAPVANGQFWNAIATVRDHLRKWSGQEPTLSAGLAARTKAADANLQRMAFAEHLR